MKLDRTSLIGVVVCVILYIGYESYLNKKYPNRYNKTQVASTEAAKNSPAKSTDQVAADTHPEIKLAKKTAKIVSVKKLSETDLKINSKEATYVLDQNFGGFKTIELTNYLDDDKQGKISMINGMLGFLGTNRNELTFPASPYKAERISERAIKFSREEDSWLIEHTIEIDEKTGYGSVVDFKWTNLTQESRQLNSTIYIFNKIKLKEKKGGFLPDLSGQRQTVTTDINGSQNREDFQNIFDRAPSKGPYLQESNPQVTFAGFDNHYFLSAFIPQTKGNKVHHLVIDKNREYYSTFNSSLFTIKQTIDQGMVKPGESRSFKLQSWNGPKSQKLMTAYSANLTEAIDLGWFSAICHVFFAALEFLYQFTGNWGVAIITFTIIIKVALYPLAKSSAAAMHRMKKLQPILNDIKEKYKNDPHKQQQETMKFMREHNANPFKGCLPMLPTIPIFIACWRTLQSSIELRQAPFFWWIQDLAAADPYFITPILGGALMMLQQKMTPTTGMDKTQENMMMLMPVMFTFVMLTMPAGVVLYSLTNTVMTFLQQQWLNKKLEQSAA